MPSPLRKKTARHLKRTIRRLQGAACCCPASSTAMSEAVFYQERGFDGMQFPVPPNYRMFKRNDTIPANKQKTGSNKSISIFYIKFYSLTRRFGAHEKKAINF